MNDQNQKESIMKCRIAFAIAMPLIVALAAVPAASAQRFYQIPNAPALTAAAPGGVSVWGEWACQGCISNVTYQFLAGQFRQVSTPTPFANISVGGGSVMQFDEVWATDFNGNIFQWDNYGLTFHQVTGSLQNVVVGEGYSPCHQYEVWGSNINHEVYRYNYCSFSWDSIPGFFGNLAVGGGEVWALNGYNQVFRFNSSTNQFDLMPGTLSQISVGAGGVWGTYTDQFGTNSVWQFDPSTQNWQQLPGPMTGIAAGADGVFGFLDTQFPVLQATAYRLNVSTRTWTQVYSSTGGWSSVGPINVGTGAGTWMAGNLTVFDYLSF